MKTADISRRAFFGRVAASLGALGIVSFAVERAHDYDQSNKFKFLISSPRLDSESLAGKTSASQSLIKQIAANHEMHGDPVAWKELAMALKQEGQIQKAKTALAFSIHLEDLEGLPCQMTFLHQKQEGKKHYLVISPSAKSLKEADVLIAELN